MSGRLGTSRAPSDGAGGAPGAEVGADTPPGAARPQVSAAALRAVYPDGRALTPDQGGRAKTAEFCAAVTAAL